MFWRHLKISRLWAPALAFSGAFSAFVAAQNPQAPLVTPKEAAVTGTEFQKLIPGKQFIFQLRFSPAPNGYEHGTITAEFKNVDSQAKSERFTNPDFDTSIANTTSELHDGQAIYTFSLPIQDWMAPGTWKLTNVSLGQFTTKDIPILGEASFEVPQIEPLRVEVQAPAKVEAGKNLTFTVTLNHYPSYIEQYPSFVNGTCSFNLRPSLRRSPPTGGVIDLDQFEDQARPTPVQSLSSFCAGFSQRFLARGD